MARLGDFFVDVGVAPVAIQGGESVADTGENGFAFLQQLMHGELMPTSPKGGLDRADQCERAQRTRNESDVRVRANQIQDTIPCTGHHDEWQIGPWRLRAQIFLEPRDLRAGECFFGQQDRTGLIADVMVEMIGLFADFDPNFCSG